MHWFEYFAREYDAPIFGIHPPTNVPDVEESHIADVVKQFEELIRVLEEIQGRPMRREDLENKVELVRNLIRRQDNDRWKKPALSLAKTLVDPILESGHLKNVQHLYLVPHGILNYLPFALLPGNGLDGTRLMIEEFTLAYLPTAAALLRESRTFNGSASMLSKNA